MYEYVDLSNTATSLKILSFNDQDGTPAKRSFKILTIFSISLASTDSGK